jgi:hypothetical protein
MKKILVILLALGLFAGNLVCPICHGEEDNTLSSLPPFTIAVDILQDGKLVGVGKCDVRINLGNWKDRIEIIEFVESDLEKALSRKPTFVITLSYLLEIVEKEVTSPGVYRLVCKDFDGTIYKGWIDFSKVRKYDSDTWDKEYKIELRTINGKVVRNISSEGKRFKEKFISKVGL